MEVPTGSYFRARYNPKVFKQRLSNEKACCMRLQRYPTGTSTKSKLKRSTNEPQCIIPVIEGLQPSDKHENDVLDLIFLLTTWHAYAKLCLHTDNTLASFDALTKPLGTALRYFAGKFSDHFNTKELPKETDTRKQREAAGKDRGKVTKKPRGDRDRVRFNLTTYKLHALGDYVSTIRQRGTTDSYNTQAVRQSTRLPLDQFLILTNSLGR